jgi:hypothetical protein
MKQFILDKHDEVPKEVFVTLMKSLDVETFCDVVYALKTKVQKQRTEAIFTTYHFRFWWNKQGEFLQEETHFGVPTPPHEDHWVSFEIKGEVRPKGTIVWLAVDLKDDDELHYESYAWRTQVEAYNALHDAYTSDFINVLEDRGDDEIKVKAKLLSGQFYDGRFSVLKAKLP